MTAFVTRCYDSFMGGLTIRRRFQHGRHYGSADEEWMSPSGRYRRSAMDALVLGWGSAWTLVGMPKSLRGTHDLMREAHENSACATAF